MRSEPIAIRDFPFYSRTADMPLELQQLYASAAGSLQHKDQQQKSNDANVLLAIGGVNAIYVLRCGSAAQCAPAALLRNRSACHADEIFDACASRYLWRRTRRLSSSRQPWLLHGLRELTLTQALSEKGVTPRMGTSWLEGSAPFAPTPYSASAHQAASRAVGSSWSRHSFAESAEQRRLRQPVHINSLVERLRPIGAAASVADLAEQVSSCMQHCPAGGISASSALHWTLALPSSHPRPRLASQLVRLVVAVATTDLSAGQIGAGLVNLDLKLGHVYLMPGEPLRAQLIDFDYESTYHLADAHVSAACRALVMLALLAAEARKATDRAARGVLKASALHAPLRALAAKDVVCAAKVESVTRPIFCKAHCLERRTNGAYDRAPLPASRPGAPSYVRSPSVAPAVQLEPPSSLNATACEFWRHLARVVSWCGFLPPTHSSGLLSLLSLNVSVV